MALVPSGQLHKMQGQLFKEAAFDIFSQEQVPAQPTPQPDPRLEVQQEQIVEDQPNATDATAPTEQMPQDQTNQTNIGQTDPQQTVEKADEEVQQGGESDIKDSWRNILGELGVPPRLLDSLEKKLYSEETDLQSNTIKGHYMIPTYTQKNKVTKDMALQIARKMEQQFGLTSRMKLDGRNWRIDFQTRPQKLVQDGGTSFDELSTDHEHQRKAASAMTIGEMLTSRRDELFTTMRKIAGVENA